MDATMATGAAAMMAIRVLLDHDVPEENIYLLALIMAVSGVYILAFQLANYRVRLKKWPKHLKCDNSVTL